MYRLAVLLLVIGCAKQVSPVGPSVELRYADIPPNQLYSPEIRRELLVGRTFTVRGSFSAVCKSSTKPMWDDHDDKYYEPAYSDCKAESTTVTVTCTGPCTVDGANVTPTAPGTLNVTIEMSSKKHYHTETRTFVAKLADSFRIENCTEGPRLVEPGKPWPRCHLDRPDLIARVMVNGTDLGLPVTVRLGDHELAGTAISLATLIGTTPTGTVVDGEYDLDLSYGQLAGRARIILGRGNAP